MKKITKIAVAAVVCAIMLVAVFAVSASAADFTDTAPGAWYEKAVNYVVENGLMTGTSEKTFEPRTVFSRAMAALVSAKVADADLSAYAGKEPAFKDVKAGSWYAAAVAWASENGVAVGNGEYFMPSDPVTREQLVVMMMKLSQLLGIKNYNEADDLTIDRFTDTDKISAWALDAVKWAVKNMYISGNTNSEVNPKGLATRAEAAQIFFNLHFVKVHELLPPDTSDADALKIIESDTPRIICWGDSLTEGCYLVWDESQGLNYYTIDHENAFPTKLAAMTGLEVKNYGISAETAIQIAERQGAVPVYADTFTIPADTVPVKVDLVLDTEGNSSGFIAASLNSETDLRVCIAGVWGNLHCVKHSEEYTFTREEQGEEVTTRRLTRLVTEMMADRRSKDILVICTGSNDGPNFYTPLNEIIDYQEAMIDYADARDRYVVLDFTAQPMVGSIYATNRAMFDHYGVNTVRLHDYFMNHALEDEGIAPTGDDTYRISKGQLPSVFLCHDELHYNPLSNRIVAQLVYNKLTELKLVK